MTLRLNGSTSGYAELDSPATGDSSVATLPSGGNGTLGRMQLATAQNSTSGTSIDFTGIPSWVKRVTVMFSGVSTNGTAAVGLQIGDSGGIENTGYSGAIMDEISGANFSAGFFDNLTNAAAVRHFVYTLVNVTGNTWICQIVGGVSNSTGGRWGGGTKTLSDVLTQVRITTSNGTDTFDAGSINILVEG